MGIYKSGKFFLLIFNVFIYSGLTAQTSFSIVYENDYGLSSQRIKLVCDSTMSYWYSTSAGPDILSPGKKAFGEKLINHGTYFIKKTNSVYSTVNLGRKTKFLFEQPYILRKWSFSDDSKIILGYKCKKALAINHKGDSTLAYYIESSISGAPMFGYTDVPGIILQVYNQENNQFLQAEQITRGNFKILFPDKAEIVSTQEKDRRIDLWRRRINR